MATVTVHTGNFDSYLYIDYYFNVSGRNWTCYAALKLQMGPTYNFDAWVNVCGNSATLQKNGSARYLAGSTITLVDSMQVGSGTYDAQGNAPSLNVTWAWNVNSSWANYQCPHGTAKLTGESIGPEYTPPSGLAVEWNSHTWNSVTGKVTLSSYGVPSSETNRYIELGVCSSSNTAYGAPYRYVTASRSTNSTMTVQANSSGAFALKGATPYKIGAYASNTQLNTRILQGTVRYTPPAPLQSITKTETRGDNYISTTFTITGGSSTNNSSNSVQTQFRWSDGSTWTNWTNVGSAGTAWTAVTTAAQNVPYASNITVQARQVYQKQYSDVKELTYTSAAATAPSGLTITVNSKTWNSANLTGVVGNYGIPKLLNGRALNIGLAETASIHAASMEVRSTNVSTKTATVNQSSTAVRGGLTFKGMMTVYPYTYANNTKAENITFGNAEVLPPAPGTLSYSIDPNDERFQTISYVGVAANNITNYDPTLLTRTVRYADSDDPTNWTYIENDTQVALTTATTQQITVPAGHSIVVEAWMTYDSNSSQVSTVTLTNSSAPKRIYGSFNRETVCLDHIYGSVNGETKKLIRIYGSVNGVAKLIHEDI